MGQGHFKRFFSLWLNSKLRHLMCGKILDGVKAINEVNKNNIICHNIPSSLTTIYNIQSKGLLYHFSPV
jgi:hypothetical protein